MGPSLDVVSFESEGLRVIESKLPGHERSRLKAPDDVQLDDGETIYTVSHELQKTAGINMRSVPDVNPHQKLQQFPAQIGFISQFHSPWYLWATVGENSCN